MSTDLRVLLHAVVNPSSNEGYVRDQQTLSNLFKEPARRELQSGIISADRSRLVPEARKPEIRERLFRFLEEQDLAIARPQLGLLVAVARIEYPRTWQNLPQLLLQPLLTCLAHLNNSVASSSSTSTVLLNTLWTINALVKEWRTVKVTQGAMVMQAFEQVFTDPLQRVLAVWGEDERNGRGDWVLGEAGRTLARFCQWHWSRAKGLQTDDSHSKIQSLVHHTVHHAPIIQSHRLRIVSEPRSEKLLRSLTKHLRAVGKWWRVMLAIDPKGFCKVPGVTAGVGWWWGEVGGVVAGSDGSVANDVFSPEFILSAFHLLVDKLLPLTSTDLEALEDEPEEWLIAESVDEEAWAFEFRKVCHCMWRCTDTSAAPPNDLPSVLRRESVYCALGRLSRSMSAYGGVDFNALLNGMGVWIGQGQPFNGNYRSTTSYLFSSKVYKNWHNAAGLEGEWLFKASLVVLTTKLVSAAKESSGDLMELVIPLIEESLQPPAKDFFEEDGLILWQTALHNAASPYQPTATTGLIRLLPGLLNMLGENMDLLPKLLGLLDSYILLDAASITQALVASKSNSNSIKRLLLSISLLIRTAPLAQLAPLLLHAGIFQHITVALEDDKASGLVLAAYLEILARIAMVDPNMFLQMVGESARMQSKDGAKLLEEVLDALWRNFDYLGGETRMRKAVAMGAGALLTTSWIVSMESSVSESTATRTDPLVNIFLDVLGEVQTTFEDPSGTEAGLRPWQDEHSTLWTDIQDTPEGKRRVALEDADPAYAVPLKTYVVQILTQAQAVGLGPYWDKADEGTKHSLQKFLG
ncbi:hypothetical protein IAR55_002091 [Kwoniella newhampshirensis]|uniref:Importin-7/11-like TPR repeats domain-containing protein n=1 Tax=Kwoniella newhampshirensis TaxID=1651941 RepID=A0AAW0Z0U5_9TREE